MEFRFIGLLFFWAHKKIILGKNGNMIKTIGTNSRLQLEKIMKKKVNLFIKIKVAQKNK